MNNKQSKFFTEKEVINIDEEGTVYLREGVRRKHFRDSEEFKESTPEHVNQDLIYYSKYLEAKRIIEDENNYD